MECKATTFLIFEITLRLVLFPQTSMEVCVFFTAVTGHSLQDFKDVLTTSINKHVFFSAEGFKNSFLIHIGPITYSS